MTMKYAVLAKYKNGIADISDKAMSVTRTGAQGDRWQESAIAVESAGDKASALLGKEVLALTKREGGGLWIPYLAGRTVFGFLSGGQSWLVSGPFSGCYFEIGTFEGRVYGAHVSCEGKDDANVEAWKKGPLSGGKVLISTKVGMSHDLPVGTRNAAAIVFAAISGETVAMTRVDIQTQSAGSMSGPIFDVAAM
jgi:hypothetical protein